MFYILFPLLISIPVTKNCAPINFNTGQDIFSPEPTLGIPIQTYGPYIIRGVGTENIEDVADLYCSDFSESCQWFNIERTDIPWLIGQMQLDSSHMKIATGTEILPEGVYAIAITDQQKVSDANAILASRIINCQNGYGQLRFKYWMSTGVELDVCSKLLIKAYPNFETCTDVSSDEVPGPAFINIKDFNQQPFQVFIRAKNFIFNTPLLKGGFAIVDDIEYHADLCGDSTSSKKNQESIFSGFHLADSVIPIFNGSDDQQKEEKNREHLLKAAISLENPIPNTEVLHTLPSNSDREEMLLVNLPSAKPIKTVEEIGTSQISNEYEYSSETLPTSKYLMIATAPSLTKINITPRSICSALNCSFNDDICKEYLEGTGWKISNGAMELSTPPDNIGSKGFFAYVSGPLTTSRWKTSPLVASATYRLSFPYLKIAKRAKFLVFSKRIGDLNEKRIYQAPRLRSDLFTWHSAEILINNGSYEYIAFEIKNLADEESFRIGRIEVYSLGRMSKCLS